MKIITEEVRQAVCEAISDVLGLDANGMGPDDFVLISDDDIPEIADAAINMLINQLRESAECEWTTDEEDSYWYNSDCGMSFVFVDGGPEYNGFKYCPKCGKKLKEIPWEEEDK